MRNIVRSLLVAALLANTIPTTARADVIRDWNQNMLDAALVPPATSPLVMTRVAAIVQSAVFDAVNGIERRYTPIHVEPAAPRGDPPHRAGADRQPVAVLFCTIVRPAR